MILKKIKDGNKRQIYLFGKKILSYKKTTDPRIARLEQELNYIKSWQTDFYKEIPQHFPLVLTDKEKQTLISYQKKSNKYLEFGSGGSTFLALINSNAEVHSVESDNEWINYLRSWKLINNKEENKKVFFNIVNIGPTKEWGYPINDNMKCEYPKYSSAIFAKNKNFDTIFIDGRFRVACAFAAAINCPDATFLMHDYTIRKNYHVIEDFFDIKETIDTLVVFTLKKGYSVDKLQEMYEEYKYITF